MKISALGYVGINATDPQAWTKFGPEILGLALGQQGPDGTVYLRMDERAYRLAVHSSSGNGLGYLGWELPTPAALEQAYKELEAAGLKPQRGSEQDCALRQVSGLVRATDPAGIALELFYGQLAICEPFQPARAITGFVTGSLGLGHAVIGVPNLTESGRFYTQVMGFRLSDVVPNRLVFFHCNQRHHSLAFIQAEKTMLRHIMLEVKTIDDVGQTYDLCQARKIPLTRTLGRHSNDQMFSFYMKSPSGFDMEYGTSGRLVDDATWTVQQVDRGSLWGHHPVTG